VEIDGAEVAQQRIGNKAILATLLFLLNKMVSKMVSKRAKNRLVKCACQCSFLPTTSWHRIQCCIITLATLLFLLSKMVSKIAKDRLVVTCIDSASKNGQGYK
jgi:hypothetical protein